ncbi:ribbon-helix-helix protein, CopG family [Bradyrhizobium sp. WSM4349]|uniref:ribbon-helix-helix protein, CopG family n=1 Tax=Bradyrhizobium sp. WSM4349 TaxID=1040988 RepID=UPI00037238E9|nr:ribbon-helix-helix protein, CopG family [Bradyrhizobium sp. WSM4349]
MDDPVNFEQLVQFRAPVNLSEAIDTAAKQRCQSRSDFIRQTIIERLQREGIPLGADTQYALVSDGQLVRAAGNSPILTFKPDADKRGEWVQIENVDSHPFDPAQHWRLKPLKLRLDGDRVVRTYPVVPKSMEHA